MLFAVVAGTRRLLYSAGWLSTYRAPVPVIVVGNITVGGSGKSPLVVALAQRLKDTGYHVGIVCRGYKAGTQDQPVMPLEVDASTPTHLAGDEAVMIAQATACPVVVDKRRGSAIKHLLQQHKVDVVLSDDGLQHYAMARDIEIVVVSEFAGFGNGFLLPAGPLREPVSRLSTVDFVVRSRTNSAQRDSGDTSIDVTRTDSLPASDGNKVFAYTLQIDELVRLDEQQRVPLADVRKDGVKALLATKDNLATTKLIAMAGIANPERFFQTFDSLGLDIQRTVHPDHYSYSEDDFKLFVSVESATATHGSCIYLMTEKDAVKCRELAIDKTKVWYCKTTVELDDTFVDQLLGKLKVSRTHSRDNAV